MPPKSSSTERRTVYHKDGSVWAKGKLVKGKPDGYWEWFRKGGTKMRSGYFKNGKQTGKWTTNDSKNRVVKVTNMRDVT